MITLERTTRGEGFSSVSLRGGLLRMGHILNVDHFIMSRATFPPHPHAGFSAVTWMLPWSQGAFINRDSRGDRSRIGPGALHWTLAGSGIIHEEIPEQDGTPCEGLQMFVKLPQDHELTAPEAIHLDPDAVPTLRHGDATIRVLTGALALGDAQAVEAPTPSHGTTLLHVSVRGALALPIPEGVEAFVFALRGVGTLDGQRLIAGQAAQLMAGQARLDGESLEALVGFGPAMASTPAAQGPIILFDRAQIAPVIRRYQTGALGRLDPSPVTWSR